MKKIFSNTILLLAGVFALSSCEKDLDSNPSLVNPTTFTLNTPAVSSNIELENTNSITLTWSQPQFTEPNAPVAANYLVQFSPTGSFNKRFDPNAEENPGADYFQFDETFTTCSATFAAEDIDKAAEQILGWESEADVPSSLNLTFRVLASVQNASFETLSSITSNDITLGVIPYYVMLVAADPDIWYLIGGDIADGTWGGSVPTQTFPMETVKDYAYNTSTGAGVITWTGYLAGNGFKLKHIPDSWNEQWGQGSSFGDFVKNDGGSANITVPAAGIYTVTLNTETDELTIEATDNAKVFTGMCIAGDFNGWGDTEMAPIHTAVAENHDWYTTVTLDGTQGIKFKEPGSWDYNSGGALVQLQDGSYYGTGSNNGENLFPAAGTYLVIYNDITRHYRFILQQ